MPGRGAAGVRDAAWWTRTGRALAAVARELQAVWQLARRERLTTLVGILLALLLAGSILFYIAEAAGNPRVQNLIDALYWGVISVTTAGYGDVVPLTPLGRASAMVMMVSFMALMPLVGATVTSIYVSRKIKGEAGLERITATGHILICGWNNNGPGILTGLTARGETRTVAIVGDLATDHFENLVEAFPKLDLKFVKGPFTSEAVLQRANVRQAATAFVLITYGLENMLRSDEVAVLAVLTLRELGPNVHIVAECFASTYRGHLRRAGANRVIVSGELDGFMLTAAALSPGLDTSLRDALTFGLSNDLWTVAIPPEFAGKTYLELAQHWLNERCWVLLGLIRERRKLGIHDVLGHETGSIDEFIFKRFEQAGRGMGGAHHVHFLNPGPDHVIDPGDTAIVIFPPEESSDSAA